MLGRSESCSYSASYFDLSSEDEDFILTSASDLDRRMRAKKQKASSASVGLPQRSKTSVDLTEASRAVCNKHLTNR